MCIFLRMIPKGPFLLEEKAHDDRKEEGDNSRDNVVEVEEMSKKKEEEEIDHEGDPSGKEVANYMMLKEKSDEFHMLGDAFYDTMRNILGGILDDTCSSFPCDANFCRNYLRTHGLSL